MNSVSTFWHEVKVDRPPDVTWGVRLINVNNISVQSLKYTSFVIYIISLLCEVLNLTEQPKKRCD